MQYYILARVAKIISGQWGLIALAFREESLGGVVQIGPGFKE
jgi:hypothetical protein